MKCLVSIMRNWASENKETKVISIILQQLIFEQFEINALTFS